MREAWIKIQRWYREAKDKQVTPTREGLEHTSTLGEDIYRRRPQEGEPIPILLQPVSIADGPLEGEDILFSVHKLRTGWAVGPSIIKAKQLKTWLREATREKDPNTEKWDKLVSITKVVLQDGYIQEALVWKAIVLIPKGGGGYRGI